MYDSRKKLRGDIETTWYSDKDGNPVCERIVDGKLAIIEQFNVKALTVTEKTIDLVRGKELSSGTSSFKKKVFEETLKSEMSAKKESKKQKLN